MMISFGSLTGERWENEVGQSRPSRRRSVQSVGNAGEDDSWLEEEQAFYVEGALVVEEPLWAAEDQFRHDHDRYGIRIGRDFAEIANEWVAHVPEVRLLYLQWQRNPEVRPLLTQTAGLVGVEGEEHRPRVLHAERPGVVDGAHRRCMRSRDEDAAHDTFGRCRASVAREDGHVTDDDAGFTQKPDFERQLGAARECGD